jgi:hypothetical protein
MVFVRLLLIIYPRKEYAEVLQFDLCVVLKFINVFI